MLAYVPSTSQPKGRAHPPVIITRPTALACSLAFLSHPIPPIHTDEPTARLFTTFPPRTHLDADDHLDGVPEGGVEEAAHGVAHVVRHLLRQVPQHGRQGDQGADLGGWGGGSVCVCGLLFVVLVLAEQRHIIVLPRK